MSEKTTKQLIADLLKEEVIEVEMIELYQMILEIIPKADLPKAKYDWFVIALETLIKDSKHHEKAVSALMKKYE